jgi:hypothetical protein
MSDAEPSRLRTARKASERALLAVEAAALVKLRYTVRQVVLSAASTPSGAVSASHVLEDAIAADLLRVRTAARRESRARFADELQAVIESPLPLVASRNHDAAETAQTAKAFAAAWLSATLDELRAESATGAGVRGAQKVDHRVAAMATTEVAEPFSDEREQIGDAYAKDAERHARPIPLKIWWATLDRTCTRCRSLNGTVRPFGIPFPGGDVPGGAHPRCKCFESITAVGFVQEDEEAA